MAKPSIKLVQYDSSSSETDPESSTPALRSHEKIKLRGGLRKHKSTILSRMTPRTKYSTADIRFALDDIKNGNFGIRKTASKYHIPESTLRGYLKSNSIPKKKKMGPQGMLTEEEEMTLVKFIKQAQRRAYSVTKGDLMTAVSYILKMKKNIGIQRMVPHNVRLKPGKSWCRLFLKRHPTISFRTPETLSPARIILNEQFIRDWFQNAEENFTSIDEFEALVDPSINLSSDETGFSLGPKSKVVLANKSVQNCFKVPSGNDKKNITVLDTEPCSNIASHLDCISEQPTLPDPPDRVNQEKLFIVKSSNQQEQPFEKSLLKLDFESGQVTNLSGSPPNDVVSFIKQILNAVYCELLKVIKKEDTYKGEHILKCFLSVIQAMTLQISEYGFHSNGSANSNDSSHNNEMLVETNSLNLEKELPFPRGQNDISNDELDNSALSKVTKSDATNALPQEVLFPEMSNFVDNETLDDNMTHFEKELVSNEEKSYFKVEEEAFELSECSDEYKSLVITSIPGKCISNESILSRKGNSNNLVKFPNTVEEKNHSSGSNIFDNTNTEPILQNVDTFVEYLDLKSEGNCSLYCSLCNQSLADQEVHNCTNFDNCIESNQSNVKTLRMVTTNNSSLKKKFCLKLKENSTDLKLSKSPSVVIEKSLRCKLRKYAATKIIYDSGFSFKCSECNFIGQKLNLLFKHVATTHFLKNFKNFGNIDDKDPACKINVQCPACSNTYVHLSYLFQHISIVHKKVKPFNCNICNESYSQKYQLSKHYIQHAIQS